MIPTKYQNESDAIKLLFQWGDPFEQEKPYSYHDWEDYLQFGFTAADVPSLLKILVDEELDEVPEESSESWAALYAWRILGQLKSEEAIEPLVTMIESIEDHDFVLSEVPVALGMIGKPVMPWVADTFHSELSEKSARIAASTSLTEVAKHHPECREEVIAHFRKYMHSPDKSAYGFNGLLVANLLDMKAIELIDEVHALYQMDCLDQSIPGDVEDMEIDFGLRDERATPRPNYKEIGDKYRLKESPILHSDSMIDWEYTSGPVNNAETFVRATPKLGRNDPCFCGSGKKYKKCCLNK